MVVTEPVFQTVMCPIFQNELFNQLDLTLLLIIQKGKPITIRLGDPIPRSHFQVPP